MSVVLTLPTWWLRKSFCMWVLRCYLRWVCVAVASWTLNLIYKGNAKPCIPKTYICILHCKSFLMQKRKSIDGATMLNWFGQWVIGHEVKVPHLDVNSRPIAGNLMSWNWLALIRWTECTTPSFQISVLLKWSYGQKFAAYCIASL